MKVPNELHELKPRLSSDELLTKEFKKKFRGYDPVEVDNYFDIVIQDYQLFDKYFSSAQTYIAQLEQQLETTDKRPIELADLSDDLQLTLSIMKKMIDKRRSQSTN